MTPRAMTCPSCGAPLAPEPSVTRARCTHCGAISEVATEGVLRVARALANAGVTVSPTLITMEQIEAEIRERDEAMRARQRITAVWIAVAFVLLGGLALLSMTPAR